MSKIYALENEKSWKSLLMNDGKLFLINKSYSTAEELIEKYNEKSIFRSRKEIEITSINKLSHPETNPVELKVNFGSKSELLKFASTDDLQEFTQDLAKQKGFIAQTTQVSKLKAITNPLIGLVFSAGIGWLLYTMAETLEAGGEVDVSGRKSLYKRLFAWLAEQLGTKGTLIAATICAGLSLYFLYKNLQNPPNQIVYE